MINLENENHVRNFAILVLFVVVTLFSGFKKALIYLAVGLMIGLVYRFIYQVYVKFYQPKE